MTARRPSAPPHVAQRPTRAADGYAAAVAFGAAPGGGPAAGATGLGMAAGCSAGMAEGAAAAGPAARGRGSAGPEWAADPLPAATRGLGEWLPAALAVLLIVQCCCLPLRGDPGAAPAAWSWRDMAQNVMLYVPLGLALALVGRRRGLAWGVILPLTVLLGAGLSASLECLQRVLPGRVASAEDVLFNAVGAAAGAAGALGLRRPGSRLRRSLRRAVRRQPMFITYLAGAGVLVAAALATGASRAAAGRPSLEKADRSASVMAAAGSMPATESARRRWEARLELAAAALLFGGLGLLAAAGLLEEFEFSPAPAALLLTWMTGLAAVGAAASWAIAGGGLPESGMAAAAFAGTAAGYMLALRRNPRRVAAGLARPAVWCCLGLSAAYELSPFEFDFSAQRVTQQWDHAGWLPGRKYFLGEVTLGPAADILARSGRYGVLGLLLAFAAWVGDRRSAWHRISPGTGVRRCAAQCVMLAVAIEALQLGCVHRSIDSTHVLTAGAAAAAGCAALQAWLGWIARLRSTARPC